MDEPDFEEQQQQEKVKTKTKEFTKPFFDLTRHLIINQHKALNLLFYAKYLRYKHYIRLAGTG